MSVFVFEATFISAVVFIFGLMIGSFLNVVIYRLPADESIVWPGSRCPHCKRALTAWENVPVVSWLALRGRCFGCKAPIAWRYPANELATGLLFWYVHHLFGLGWQSALLWAFIALLIVTFWIDIDHMVILEEITIAGAVLGLVYSAVVTQQFWFALAAALGAVAVLMLINSLALLAIGRDGIGDGDFFLVAMMGTWLGLSQTGLALLLAMVAGALMGLGLLFARWFAQRLWQPFALAVGVAVPLYGATCWLFASLTGDGGLQAVSGLSLAPGMRVALAALAGLLGASAGWLYMRVSNDEDGMLEMPFGPALVLGAVASLFWGLPMIEWYWARMGSY